MHKFPLNNPKPDFENLLKVLAGKKEPDKVLFCEMLIDEEIKGYIIESHFGQKNYPPTVTFGGSAGDAAESPDYKETKEASERYYRQLIDFYYRMG